MLKKIIEFFNFKIKEYKYEPYVYVNQEKEGFIIQNSDYKVNVEFHEDFVYFNFEKYYFCMKQDNENYNSKTDILNEIIKRTNIFSLKEESFKHFLNTYAYNNSESFDFYYKLKQKKNKQYKNQIYSLLEIECNNFIKNVKKIKVKIINDDGSYIKNRGYLNNNVYFHVSNLNHYLYRIHLNSHVNRSWSERFSMQSFTSGGKLENYTGIKVVDDIINSVKEEVDLSRISVLECFDKFLFLTEIEGKRNIVFFIKMDEKNYYSLIMENGKINNTKKLYNENDIQNFQISIFTKIYNNYNLVKKYYSKELIYKLSQYDLIKEESSINKDIINLYRMLKI